MTAGNGHASDEQSVKPSREETVKRDRIRSAWIIDGVDGRTWGKPVVASSNFYRTDAVPVGAAWFDQDLMKRTRFQMSSSARGVVPTVAGMVEPAIPCWIRR